MKLNLIFSRSNLMNLTWGVLFFIPFYLFISTIIQYSVNVPAQEDFDLILVALNKFLSANMVAEKLGIFFALSNQHRPVVLKVLALIQYLLIGEVNFKYLIVIGAASYIIFVLALSYWLFKRGITKFQLLPIVYLLLNFVQHEIMLGIATSSNFYLQALFALLLFISIESRKPSWAGAFYGLSIFSLAGGLVLYPIVSFYLFLQKRWRELYIYFGISSFLTIIYFYHFRATDGSGNSGIFYSFLHFDQTLAYLITVFGNIIPSSYLAPMFGVIILCMLLIVVIQTFNEKHPYFLISAWVFATLLVISLSRTYLGISQALSSRYSIYVLISIVCIYLWLVRVIKSQSILSIVSTISILLSVGFFAGIYTSYEVSDMFDRNRDMKILSISALTQKSIESFLQYPDPEQAEKVLKESAKTGVYNYRNTSQTLLQEVQFTSQIPEANSEFVGLLDDNYNNTYLYAIGWAFIPNLQNDPGNTFILIRNDKMQVATIQAYMIERSDVSVFYERPFLYDYSGYLAYLGVYDIPAGTYEVGIMICNGDKVAIHWEESKFIIP